MTDLVYDLGAPELPEGQFYRVSTGTGFALGMILTVEIRQRRRWGSRLIAQSTGTLYDRRGLPRAPDMVALEEAVAALASIKQEGALDALLGDHPRGEEHK